MVTLSLWRRYAFEATVRLGGLARAATQLNITLLAKCDPGYRNGEEASEADAGDLCSIP
jgi:hypothetical protein